ncbi:MAG TPA: prepilin-type N-terminal cleavage/methylation domain-containing protein [Candidatus Paceibacterota bacterium]|jgi:prepilin-type N-terminal cleavage/methylation domain-containing protein|nr:prepilin-type N-terminal cleavage/methylation domain-containing protein [Candidatus Paceibacterota bacterium]
MKKMGIQKSQGFTIVEMLVSTAIFLIVLTITTSLFLVNVRTQRYLLASVNASENISYAIEVMGREIRTGKNFSSSNNSLSFLNTKNETVKYSLINDRVKREVGGQSEFLTSENIEVTNLNFRVLGNSPDDSLQTRVTILLEVKTKAGNQNLITNLETTLSSRQLEIQ